MMKSIRRHVSGILSDLGDTCYSLAMRVSGQEAPRPTEEDVMTLQAKIHQYWTSPCPTCSARGWVRTPTGDSAICPICRGTGVDVVKLAQEAVKL